MALPLASASSVSATSTNRVIALVDMDCFYVQVEERDNPEIKGVPAAVVQYKAFKGGGIIAVNYEARAKGVSRNIRGDDAKALCPEIVLVRVPETRGKADLTKYRDAGGEVIKVLTEFSSCVERASVDEAYIDLTEAVEVRLAELSSQETFSSWGERILGSLDMEAFSTNYVLGHDSTNSWFSSIKGSEIPSIDDIKLAIGAEIVGKMREAVYQKTQFRCSAGIAHNKVVAKLVCGINKPNKQTILPHASVPALWATTKIGKVRGLGGKLGDHLTEIMGCVQMSDLLRFSEKELSAVLGSKTGAWLYQLSLGFDDEPVIPRQLPKSIGCNKNFYGPEALKTKDKVKFWITQLAEEVTERIVRDLEVNNRRAKTLTLHVKFEDQNPLSRSCGVNPQYNAERMTADAFAIMERLFQTLGTLPVNSLGLIASKFEDEMDTSGYGKINEFFKAKSDADSSSTTVGSSKRSSASSSAGSSKARSSLSIESYFGSGSSASSNDSSGSPVSSDEPSAAQKIDDPPVPVSKNLEHKSKNVLESNKVVSTSTSSSTSKGTSESETRTITTLTSNNTNSNSALPNTPMKSSNPVDNSKPEGQLRKAFFSFSETVPKVSPRKSPRKFTPTKPVRNEDTPFNSAALSTTIGVIGDKKECERCGKKVSVYDLPSHMDFHFAKDLSREINGLPPLTFDLRPETLRKKEVSEAIADRATKGAQKRPRGGGSSSSGSKRGRGAKSASSSSTSKIQTRTIDSYFGGKS